MDKFRTVAPIILMLLTALVVFYANVSLSGSGFGGTYFVCHDRGLCLRDLCTG